MDYASDYSTNSERFLAMEFVKSTSAVLQFKTDSNDYSSSPGFVIRVLPMLISRRIVGETELYRLYRGLGVKRL